MITPPAPSAPPAVGVKVNVVAVDTLPASRSDAVIVNVESVKFNSTVDITESADVEMRDPPFLLAIVKIVKPEQVTVMEPLGKEVVVVMIILPSRTKDVDAMDGAGLDTSHFSVLPINGK